MNGRRRPAGCSDRSLIRPATGLRRTSHAFGAKTMTDATTAGTASRSVRNGSRSRPGTAPKDPVTTDPSPYPRRACDGRASAVVPAASSAPVVVGMDGA